MNREFLKVKIHRATITQSNLHYSGSLTIDEEIMEKAGISPNERVHVFNINNGERFETYAIKAKKGSRIIGLNGAAARRGQVGDLIIIVTYCYLSEEEIPVHKARVLLMGKNNEIENMMEE